MDGDRQHKRSYLRRLFTDPVSILLMTLLVVGTLFFWSQSRVPALDQKAQMAERNNITSIAFDIVYPTHADQLMVERVAKTTINWSYTNWKGMTFGLFFGVLVLSLLQLHPPPNQTKNPLLNSLIGITSGVPLGVCVNCATPIAQGMYLSGLRLEAVLATLLSSSTLNVIVLTISFSVFPAYFVLTKMLGSLIFILLIVPLVIRLTGPNDKNDVVPQRLANRMRDASQGMQRFNQKQQVVIRGSAPKCLASVGRLLVDNTIYLFKIAVPMMLAAGFFGAVLIETLPLEKLTLLEYSLLSLTFVAIIAVLLPVPIAFDVIAVSALLATGISPGIAMTLLFALGVFSIYPAMIIANIVSLRLSLGLIAAVILFAVLLGVLTERISEERSREKQELLREALALIEPPQNNLLKHQVIAKEVCVASMFEKIDECYIALIKSGSLGQPNPDLCNNYLGDPLAISSCHANIAARLATKAALLDQSEQPCADLKHTPQRESCIIRALTTQSFSTDVIGKCRTQVSSARVDNCLENIYLKRIEGLANATACALNLTKQEKNHCLALLRGYQIAETKNLAKCTSLAPTEPGGSIKTQNDPVNTTATRLCYSLIFSESPEKQTVEFCRTLASMSNKQDCLDEIILRFAVDGDLEAQCTEITAHWRELLCQRSIVARRFQRLLLQRSIHSLAPHQALGEKIEAATYLPDYIPAPQYARYQAYPASAHITVQVAPYVKNDMLGQGKRLAREFVQHPGESVGLLKLWQFKFTDFFDPFVLGRGIASGDFDNDGWSDIAISTNDGIILYRNYGGLRFGFYKRLNLSKRLDAFVVALVDLDNDGWLDVFVTAYGGRSIVFNNQKGSFNQSRIKTLINQDANVTLSTGFADWDKDGDLDFLLGNWSFGTEENFRTTFSANQRVTNDNGHYLTEAIDEITGDTLSILISDINNDHDLDIILANDRHVPDLWYFGEADGFALISTTRNDVVTSLNTMSYESADFNNDLIMDVYSSDMSFDDDGVTSYCHLLEETDAKSCTEKLAGARAIHDLDILWCKRLRANDERSSCLEAMTVKLAASEKNPTLCAVLIDDSARQLCERLAKRYAPDSPIIYDQYPDQEMSNKLLLGQLDGTFRDATLEAGVQSSYWSWSAKAADLDNDGYQDIYIGNGYEFGNPVQLFSNVFFHNDGGKRFKRAEQKFNLDFMPNTSSFTYADFDRDGDIDIVTSSVMSQPFLLENQVGENRSIQFSLMDKQGNRNAVGAKITIRYGNQSHQMREIKLSGGYQSFDETVVTFGLAHHRIVGQVEIHWPSGEISELNNLPTNARYLITRAKVP